MGPALAAEPAMSAPRRFYRLLTQGAPPAVKIMFSAPQRIGVRRHAPLLPPFRPSPAEPQRTSAALLNHLGSCACRFLNSEPSGRYCDRRLFLPGLPSLNAGRGRSVSRWGVRRQAAGCRSPTLSIQARAPLAAAHSQNFEQPLTQPQKACHIEQLTVINASGTSIAYQ